MDFQLDMDVRRGGYSYLAVKDGARERPLPWAVNNVDGLAPIATFAMELSNTEGYTCPNGLTWRMVLSDD